MLAVDYTADDGWLKNTDTHNPVATQIAIDAQGLRPSTESVARYLGGADYTLSPKMRHRVDKGIETAVQIVTPHLAYRVVSASQIRSALDTLWPEEDHHRFAFDVDKIPAHYAAVCLATLGEELDIACRSMADQNKFYQAMLLDAVGTAMLDIMGARLETLVDGEARLLGLYAGCRLGPGLGGMALESQILLFNLLDGCTMSIRLNEAFVMEPTKTISAFILFEAQEKSNGRKHKCSRCTLKDCQFRTKPQGSVR